MNNQEDIITYEQIIPQEYSEAATVQEDEQEALMEKENVVGVGIGYKQTGGVDTDELCVTVFVTQKVDESLLSSQDVIPGNLGKKIPSDVVEVDQISALEVEQVKSQGDVTEGLTTTEEEEVDTQILRSRIRPVKGGYSVGHYKITAGTIATVVFDRSPYPSIPRKYYILSNNHVLANSNQATINDPILQPGAYDGGRYPKDLVARLSRYVPIRFGGPCNYVDAAIAAGPFSILDRDIYWIGYVKGVAGVKIGTIVQKTGRTTNYTTGRVTHINATVNVNYGSGRVAKMCRQIVTTNMSAPGDSGSLLLDMNEKAVGLLFAGSSRVTIHNDIRYVQSLLGIRIV